MDHPPTLDYATPSRPVSGFARSPVWLVVLVAMIVPGLSSFLIRRRVGRFLCHLAAMPLAFLLFGPIWGEVLFPSPNLSELGLFPFIATCTATYGASVYLALKDRREAL